MRSAWHRAAGLLLAASLAGACSLAGATAPIDATPTPPPSPSGPSRPFRPTPAPAPTFAIHVVERGDTLIALADRFETTPESIAYWNRTRYPSLDPDSPRYRPNRIEVGWELAYLPGTVVDPEDLPPTASADPGPGDSVVGPFPTLPGDGSAALVTNGPRGLSGVALTFDYGGGDAAADTPAPEAIVQWLEVNGVPATVFVGPAAADPEDAAGGAVLDRLGGARGVAAGLLAGPSGAPLSASGLRAADAQVAAVLGSSTAPLLRPSSGAATPDQLAAAGAAGWRWAVAWDVDAGDGVAPGDGGPIALDIVARVVSRAEGGSIVRLQLDGARTLEALPGIVEGLAAAGLDVLPLDEVLGR
jgi:hypothetical protein